MFERNIFVNKKITITFVSHYKTLKGFKNIFEHMSQLRLKYF